MSASLAHSEGNPRVAGALPPQSVSRILIGLPAVSKFKPRLPAQGAFGTHHKGPSRIEK